MKNYLSKQKLISACIYAAAVFAAVYGAKYIIDALAYIITNMGYMFKSAANLLAKLLHIFAILVFGLITAYILDPAVGLISRKFGVGRRTAVFIIYIIIILIAAFTVYGILSRIYIYDKNDISNAFSLAFKHYQKRIYDIGARLELFIKKYDRLNVSDCLYQKLSRANTDNIKLLRRVGTVLSDLFLGTVLAFYFLKDKNILLKQAKYIFTLILPKKIQPVLLYIWHETDSVFSGYIRGQLADAVIMSILAASLLTILRIPFAAVIGIITGLANNTNRHPKCIGISSSLRAVIQLFFI